MADQPPQPPAEELPKPNPPKPQALDQIKLKRKRMRKHAKEAAKAQPPPPEPDKPKLPVPPLSPTQLQPPGQPAPAQPRQEYQDSGDDVLTTLFTNSLRRNEQVKPAHDAGMELVQSIAHLVAEAKPLDQIDDKMLPHLGEMSSKIHLMLNAMQYHNLFERGALYSLARWTLEKGLWNDLMQGQLDPTEKLALLQLAIKEMDKVTASLADFKETLEKSGRGTMSDIQTAAEKVDRSVKKEDNTAAKELEGTSALGREMARRMLDKAGKALDKQVKQAVAEKK